MTQQQCPACSMMGGARRRKAAQPKKAAPKVYVMGRERLIEMRDRVQYVIYKGRYMRLSRLRAIEARRDAEDKKKKCRR